MPEPVAPSGPHAGLEGVFWQSAELTHLQAVALASGQQAPAPLVSAWQHSVAPHWAEPEHEFRHDRLPEPSLTQIWAAPQQVLPQALSAAQQALPMICPLGQQAPATHAWPVGHIPLGFDGLQFEETQLPVVHTSPVWQTEQAAPESPHALVVLPGLHVLPVQQPEQEVAHPAVGGSHALLALHVSLAAQALQLAPPAPHALGESPVMQTPFWQQPEAQLPGPQPVIAALHCPELHS